ncbi:MAG: hypothetical protein LQ338_003896 [Usnochroma carphineum]|nr:MAG: hypothetical protein LQ338_003896 [Usnochroma carphineum]
MGVVCLAFFLLTYLALALAPPGPINIARPSENPASPDTVEVGAYQSYRCETGNQRSNVAFNCLSVIAELRRELPGPVSFNQRYWDDTSFGCHITAEAIGRPASTIVLRDLPNDLIFLLYRCFLPVQPAIIARSASIEAGENLQYLVRIYPPRGTGDQLRPGEPPSLAKSLTSSGNSAAESSSSKPRVPRSLAAPNPASPGRANVWCAKKTDQPVQGAFTDCLPALMKIVGNPASAKPNPWILDDSKEWDAPNCIVSVARNPKKRISLDVFSEWSLIDDAVWIMGRCFAGPEAARGMNVGSTVVGPLRGWKLTLVWGTELGNGVESSTRRRVGNDTGSLLPAATSNVSTSDTEA